MNFNIFYLILLIILSLALFVILIYSILPWLFRLFVSPKFNASYIYNSKDFKKKEKENHFKIEQSKFQINFNNNLGTYSITFGKEIEFINGIIKIRHKSCNYSNHRTNKRNTKILKLILSTEEENSDKLGIFKSIMARFRLEDEERYLTLLIKNYTNQNFVVFTINIPEGLENTASGKISKVITSFPSFINKNFNNRVFTYRNKIFCPPSRKIGATSAPVLLYDDKLNCFALSPLDGFLHTIISEDKKKRINCGIQGEIKALPKDFSQSYILLFDKGINQSLKRLGDVLLTYHDSKRKSFYANIVTSYLGYWTDNGAYYYYKTEKGMNYEDTMISVKDYFEKNRIPIRYYNFDSWWYLKHTNKIFTTMFRPLVRLMGGGLYGNTLRWEVDPKDFTTDLKTFYHQKFKKPITAHSRRWDARSPYIGNYDFETYKNHAVPLKKEFWQWLMKYAKESGIQVYEQDWMKNQIISMPILMQNIDAQEKWLNNMATAGKENDIDIFYCMQTPGILLYSIKHSNINISRCSGDYNHRWPLSYRYIHSTQTNILFNAIGINSHPDVFRSRTMEHVKLRPFSESFPDFKCLYQILNAGVVAPGDRKENINWPLLQKTCRDDGLLLKPDKSLTANDLMFKKHKKYYICDTFTKLSDLTWRYILVSNIWPRRVKETFFTLEDLGFEEKDYILYNYHIGNITRIKTNDLIEVGRLKRYDYKYYIICPITSNGMALIGCPDKFVTCSNRLIIAVNSNKNFLSISVENLEKTNVRLLVYSENRPSSIQIDNDLIDSWTYNNEIKLIEINVRFDKSSRKEVLINKK